jgi:hypothetical protein
MIFSQRPGGAAYIERAERPSIESVQVATQRTGFNKLRESWDKLTAEQQEKAMKDGDWQPEAAAN